VAAADRGALYLDSSSLLVWMLAQPGQETVRSRIEEWLSGGGRLVSSRLLGLEVRRVLVRDRLAQNPLPSGHQAVLELVAQLPVTEEVWERASAIEQPVRALDAIHLATCELVGATLLTAGLDQTINDVALARGIPTI
jgi:predicted nucleic acid-binding protein